jgi:exodeoxyribonuclease-3
MMPTTIVSYNLNGLRSALDKGLVEWMRAHPADLYCFQEVKALPEQIDGAIFANLGYQAYWHSAEKKGYSGVLTLARRAPNYVEAGCDMPVYDAEGRILRLDFGEWTLLNCYFPSGTTGEERQAFKMRFLDDFAAWLANLRRQRPKLIIVGDMNIAHTEMDIHDPVGNKKSSGFLPEERAWLSNWLEQGYIDAFRWLHPEAVEYSWWSFRARAREKNKGWRIDYQIVSENLRPLLRRASHYPEARHSDHCPVFLEIDL